MSVEFFIAKRYLKAKRKGLFALITTVIGVAGVAVGVAALITTLSVMNGFQTDIRKKIIGAQSHITIYGQFPSGDAEKLKDKLLRDPEILAVAPFVFGQAILTFKDRSTGVMVKGLDPAQEFTVNDLESSITSGSWDSLKKQAPTSPGPNPTRGIVLGEELAKNMGAWIGDEVVLVSPKAVATAVGIFPKMRKFRISGTLRTGYYEFDNAMAYCSLESAADFFNLNGASGLGVRLKNLDSATKTARRLKTELGFPFVVKTFAEMNRNLFAALKLEKFVMSLILVLIVVVAAFNIASNLILLGTEKLRDIGILRALGATPLVIRRVFWWEGAMIGGAGILAGVVLGLGLSWFIGKYPIVELPSDIYYLTKVPVDIRWQDVAAIAGGTYLLCMLAAVYPAFRSSRISPVDAIRYG